MPYPEPFIAPMRAELTRLGVKELRTPADVDAAAKEPGVTMIVVNSICGCAGTVFAGADIDATDRARQLFAPYPPSSPSIGILRDGKLVFMLQRSEIENRDANQIAQRLTDAFDQVCG
jgi:hypothetical protein